MITNKEWNQVVRVFAGYGSTTRAKETYANYNSNTGKVTEPDLSGSAYVRTVNTFDKAKNIYDLAGNVWEWTSEIGPNSSYPFVLRGGSYNHTGSLQPTFIRAVSEESYTHVSYGFRVALFL